jgi:hypothetical protein
MSALERRLIILVDEWLWIGLCTYLWHAHREAFWPVFAAGVVLVYAVSYPLYFMWRRRAGRGVL